MKIAVLGTGMVGHALATRCAGLGHTVMMGARVRDNVHAARWAQTHESQSGTFADAAAFGDLVVFATLGSATLEAAALAGAKALAGKVVLDVSNPLDFSNGFPPSLLSEHANTTSAGEALQAALPQSRVVKALNTMNCDVMVDPTRIPGDHDVFLCGNDTDAKTDVTTLLSQFGWAAPIDLGPIEASRGLEGLMLFWLRLYGVIGHTDFNYNIVVAPAA
ncbi:MAG: NAD(P)-binding domain-containing protein [Pseudomonadota bacterium]